MKTLNGIDIDEKTHNDYFEFVNDVINYINTKHSKILENPTILIDGILRVVLHYFFNKNFHKQFNFIHLQEALRLYYNAYLNIDEGKCLN